MPGCIPLNSSNTNRTYGIIDVRERAGFEPLFFMIYFKIYNTTGTVRIEN